MEDSQRARDIAKAFNIMSVPHMLAVVEKEGKKSLCDLDLENKTVKECKEVEGVDLG